MWLFTTLPWLPILAALQLARDHSQVLPAPASPCGTAQPATTRAAPQGQVRAPSLRISPCEASLLITLAGGPRALMPGLIKAKPAADRYCARREVPMCRVQTPESMRT